MSKVFMVLICIVGIILLSTITFAKVVNDYEEIRIQKLIDTIFTKYPQKPTTPTSRFYDDDMNDVDGTTDYEDYTDDESCPSGNCVPFHLCSNKTNNYGIGMIDTRFKPDEPCHYLEICCPKSDQLENSIYTTPETKSLGSTHVEAIEDEIGCGVRYVNGIGLRILENDNEAQYGEFPWMVAIITEEQKAGKVMNVYLCGGSLIHPNVIVTVAHCVHRKPIQMLKVRAGEWDTQTTNEIWPHQDRRVSRIIMHEKYYAAALHNDIALIILDNPFDLIGNVKTICLPPQNYNFFKNQCVASGWGKNMFGREGSYQMILKKIELPIVENRRCQMSLRRTRLGRHFVLHRSFICAGGEPGKDTCKGDGGSPLACPIPGFIDKYYQAGIVAWGIGCGEMQVPGVYVSVSKFRNWIDKHFTEMGLDRKYYTIES